jgi:pimeloyl-ACP methyl ester carboxylesterase
MSVAILDKIAEIDGHSIAYREAGAGRTIVFLHGAGGAPPRGAAFMSLLGERHHVVLPSRPGFDDTPVGPCRTLRDVVATMAKFIDQVAGGKVHLVAQSAGAAIGCWLAVLHPERIESLVLSAPAAFAPHRALAAAPPDTATIARRLYGDHPLWAAPPTEAEGRCIADNARINLDRFAAPEGNGDLLVRLGEITVPTLLLCASADPMIPEAAMRPYQEAIASCIRIVMHSAAHELPIAEGGAWVKLVSDFVDRGEYFLVNMD